jgi:hypothetical protein
VAKEKFNATKINEGYFSRMATLLDGEIDVYIVLDKYLHLWVYVIFVCILLFSTKITRK